MQPQQEPYLQRNAGQVEPENKPPRFAQPGDHDKRPEIDLSKESFPDRQTKIPDVVQQGQKDQAHDREQRINEKLDKAYADLPPEKPLAQQPSKEQKQEQTMQQSH